MTIYSCLCRKKNVAIVCGQAMPRPKQCCWGDLCPVHEAHLWRLFKPCLVVLVIPISAMPLDICSHIEAVLPSKQTQAMYDCAIQALLKLEAT